MVKGKADIRDNYDKHPLNFCKLKGFEGIKYKKPGIQGYEKTQPEEKSLFKGGGNRKSIFPLKKLQVKQNKPEKAEKEQIPPHKGKGVYNSRDKAPKGIPGIKGVINFYCPVFQSLSIIRLTLSVAKANAS
jgi:hypothetical protein